MSSKTNNSLRGFRKANSESKKQSNILRFVRRDPETDGAGGSTSPVLGAAVRQSGPTSRMLFIDSPVRKELQGTAGSQNPDSLMKTIPKVSTIVVRKPSTVITFKTNAASTTAQAFSAFNASKLYSTKSPTSSPQSQSSALFSSPSSTNGVYDGKEDTAEAENGDGCENDSPIVRIKVRNNRIVDSDDEDDAELQRPAKKFKASPATEDKADKLLCRSYDSDPPDHIVETFLEALADMFPRYDKMELQDVLIRFRYNFKEASAHLEEEEQQSKEVKRRLAVAERLQKLKLQVNKEEELSQKDAERLSEVLREKQSLSTTSTDDATQLLLLQKEEQLLQERLQRRRDERYKLLCQLQQTDELNEKLLREDSFSFSEDVSQSSNGNPVLNATVNGNADVHTDVLLQQLEKLSSEEEQKRREELRMKQEARQRLVMKSQIQAQVKREEEEEIQRRQLVEIEEKQRLARIKEEEERRRAIQMNDPKMIAKRRMQDKKKMFKILGASSRFSQVDYGEEDEEDLYIGKSNVYFSDDSECEDEGGGVVTTEVLSMRDSVLSFLNTASEEEICAIPTCSKKKGELIASLRPFKNWEHLVEVFKREKYISPDMLNSVKNALQKRNTVVQLMKRCELISSQIHETVASLLSGEETDSAISQQPKLLNPNMTLKGYQMIGLNWLSLMLQHELNGVLADEMGLGKTVQAIAFLAHVKETINPQDLSLIVVPSSTLDNWARELELWCPSLGVLVYHGSQEERRGMRAQILQDQLDENTHIILTTYNTMYSSTEDRALFKRLRVHTVIFDEAHMLKNMNTSRFENLMRVSAECRVLLTGTPLQNNLVELMSILVFVMPQLFEGRKEELKQVFAMFPKGSDDRNKSQYEAKRIEQAKRIMKPFFLRRLKTDVLKDLPEKHDVLVTVDMHPEQRKLYTSVVDMLSRRAKQMKLKWEKVQAEKLTELEELQLGQGSLGVSGTSQNNNKNKRDDNEDKEATPEDSSANMLMTLRRVANHPLLYRKLYTDDKLRKIAKVLKHTSHPNSVLEYIVEDLTVMSDFEIHKTCCSYPATEEFKLDDSHILASGKFQKFDELLPEMKARGDRVLVFSQFVIVLDIVEEYMRLRDHKFLRLDGQTPIYERQEMIDEFNENPSIFVFLLSTKAGGLGINLTSANCVLLHDIDFNPYNDKQAEDRCHRVGQTRPVTVTRLVTRDSIEEGILSIARSKLDLEREVTGTKDEQHRKTDVLSLLKAALGITKND